MFRLNSNFLSESHISLHSFQYFRCFGWIIFIRSIWSYFKRVSILQMFRLNCYNYLKEKILKLSFNTSDVSVELSRAKQRKQRCTKFQYFRCFGWIKYARKTSYSTISFCFNTSDVSVELNDEISLHNVKVRVSILQMFRLNYNRFRSCRQKQRTFQYFRCFGWISFTPLAFRLANASFQYFRCFGWILNGFSSIYADIQFQYFRCFGWILMAFPQYMQIFSFNTSDVSVEFLLLLKNISLTYLFQYFRCFGWISSFA